MLQRTDSVFRALLSLEQGIGGAILVSLCAVSAFRDGVTMLLTLCGLLAIASAVLLWRNPTNGLLLSLFVQAVQIPLIVGPKLTYRLAIGLGLWLEAAPFRLSQVCYGTSFHFQRGWGGPARPTIYGVNIVALILFFVVLCVLLIRTMDSNVKQLSPTIPDSLVGN